MKQKPVILFIIVLVIACFTAPLQVSYAEDSVPDAFRSTNYPLPRFASMASDKVFVRAGPGMQYPVLWVFEKKHYPVEIVLEFENWRKIKDRDGETGWVHLSLLSGRRYGFVTGEEKIPAHRKSALDSEVMAFLEPGVIARISECDGGFCKLATSGYRGWVERKLIWGVYENENLN